VEVQGDKASAAFRNGVLEMRLPKTEAAKRRSITIEVR
jgi:HSP20 family molecular chaperone IbpA